MIPIPCPHFKITIVKRSQGQSAVAGAAYQSGERLFSEYDQKTKFYNKKKELVHAEIMLPPHAPPGYADRATLWNAVEAVGNQWNSQLARRIVLAFPREVPKDQYQGDCSLLERGKLDAPELMIEEVRDEIVYTHNLGKNACISLSPEEFAQKLADREEIQSYRMKQFQQSGQDCYLLMQLKRDADPALRFASMRYLEKQNIAPAIDNYEILYRGNLPIGKRSVPQPELLEQLYQKFNCAQPMDYHGHSLSVSDVILLNQAGKISAHYIDSIGFRELSGFQDKQERSSVLSQLKAKCDMPECNPTKCRKGRNDHAI